ncbi:helix-turn-helix domain-containing protein [Nakamurella flava]|nr:helix-turn-helix domain-containing protein [Nakamurella flava]
MSAPSMTANRPAAPSPEPGAAGRLRVVRTLGDVIARHRRRRGLTQQELADFSTVSIRAIRDLEHGVTLTPRPDTVRLLAETLRLGRSDRAELQELAGVRSPATAAPSRGSGTDVDGRVGAAPVVGREAELAAMRNWWDDPDPRRPAVLTVLGLPGTGKTALVRAVATERAAAGLCVVWPGSGPRRDPATRLAEAAAAELSTAPGAESSGAGVRWAERMGTLPTVLVLDDPPRAPRADVLDRMVAAAPGLRIVVTTDRPGRAAGECLALAGLRTERPGPDVVDAFALLRSPAAGAPVRRGSSPAVQVLTTGQGGWSATDRADLDDIARAVDGSPAVLRAAGALVELYGPRTVRDALARDLVGTLRAGAGDRLGDLVQRTAELIDDLSVDARDLLERWVGTPAAVEATVAGMGAITGLDLWECGRRFDELRQAALLLRVGPGRFRLPALIRALVREPVRDRAPATATHRPGGSR